MTSPEISVPDKVTITLRDPERYLLTYGRSRMLFDLLYVAGPLPESGMISGKTHVHSLVYLAQEFGVIDTDYGFSINDTLDLHSSWLSWDLSMTSLIDMFQTSRDEGHSFEMTPKAKELLEAVGGPQTIYHEDTIRELANLARNKRLTSLAKFVFIRKDVEKRVEDGILTSAEANAALLSRFGETLREELEGLEQKFRSS